LNLRFKCVVSNPNLTFRIKLEMVKKDEQKKKHKFYEGFKKFQDTWMSKHGLNLCLMKRVRCSKFDVRSAHLLKGNMSSWLPSLIAC
jgi:hypothetical protein